MNKEMLMASVEDRFEKYVSFLCDVCAFEARAKDVDELNRQADFIAAFAENEGFGVERTAIENCGDFLCIDINRGAEKGGLFLAHTDTVHDKGIFGAEPVKRLSDRIIAPGVIDCKGGIAIAMLAMRALAENGYKKHLRLILTSDEEVSNVLGGQAEMDYFEEKCKGFPCAINCETTEGDEAVVSRKGICKLKIEIKGISGHSGIHFFECRNPIVEAAHKILALTEKSRAGGTTYSANVINAGTVINVIPETCTVLADIRYVHRSDIDEIMETVNGIVNTSYVEGTTAKLEIVNIRPPMERNDSTDKLFEALRKTARENALGDLTPVRSGGGSDSCYTQALGIPSICGMGASGKYCHTASEYALIDSIETRAKILAAYFAER